MTLFYYVAILLNWLFLSNHLHSIEVADPRIAYFQSDKLEHDGTLLLKAMVKELRYCKGIQPDTDSLRLTIRLRFENNGDIPVILPKENRQILAYIIAASEDQLLRNEAEIQFRSHFTTYSIASSKEVKPLSLKLFQVVKKGESYETETFLSITIAKDKIRFPDYYLPDGDHVLRLQLNMWSFGKEHEPSAYKEMWRGIGNLCITKIQSLPMPFRTEANRLVHDCK